MSKKTKIYCAGPFFNEAQLKTIEAVESVIALHDVDIFKPRNGAASAKKLNLDIGAGKDPSPETRKGVFRDNVDNIDDADLIVAVIDGRDIGTIFEIGYACKAGVPVMTYTDLGFGMNLMLAESVLAHCKGSKQLNDALSMFIRHKQAGHVDLKEFEEMFKRSNLTEGSDASKSMKLYKEGE